MWQYQYSDELQHYGVKGMKWGVRRATKQLSRARTSSDVDNAVAKLNKHRTKATAKLSKLEKKGSKLENALIKSNKKNLVKGSKIEQKADKLRKKAEKKYYKANSSVMISDERRKAMKDEAIALTAKYEKMHAKASSLQSNHSRVKAKVEANETMQKAFRMGIDNIDKTLEKAGRRYING